MTDLPERKEFIERVATISKAEGLKFKDHAEVVDVICQSGVNVFHPISDALLADRLHAAASRRRELVDGAAPSASGLSALEVWLGPKRAAALSTMRPEMKLMLVHQHKAAIKEAAANVGKPTPAEGLRRTLIDRHGSVEAAPASDRWSLAELEGATRTKGGSFNGRSTT